MNPREVALITGTRKGIGRYLAEHLVKTGRHVIGCSRKPADFTADAYEHHCLDVADEARVVQLVRQVGLRHGRLDALINNAGIASMNHALLTPSDTIRRILDTNVVGTFHSCREAAKLMRKSERGRIVNFTTVAVPLKLEGEAAYAASKAAVGCLTQVLARELSEFKITVNAVGPTPVKTDLIRAVPEDKIESLVQRQAIKRFATFRDVANVIDFFLSPSSDMITGQVLYLGGV